MSTLESLARQVVMGAFHGPDLPVWAARLIEGGLGSVCVFGSNVRSPDDLATLTAAMHAVRPDVLIATDEEGGDVTRLHMADGSPHPGNAALGAVDDLDLTTRVAHSIGASLAAAGIDLDLAPVVDVNSNPNNPVIGVRSFGADPGLVARHTTAFIAGLQSAGSARAPSTSPATATPPSTRTSPCRPSTSRRRRCGRASWCRSGQQSRPAASP